MRARVAEGIAVENATYVAAHPRCAELAAAGREHMPGGVPMSWMVKWPGPFSLHVAEAHGAHFVCADGIEHVDLCLGDTGAMCGHSPAPVVRAVREQVARGITAMLPTADAAVVAAELTRRFGGARGAVRRWQLTLTATDANRHVLRYARAATGRDKVLVFDWCYHGTVDEAFATLEQGRDGTSRVVARRGNIGPPVDPAATTVVVPFNDVAALAAALARRDVAAVLAEPAMTNIGIVLPEPGFHDALRELTRAHGTWLVLDETHTLCAGPGGAVGAWDLDPDAVVVGKAIGGGIPIGAFGMTEAFTRAATVEVELEQVDVGGIGGTLAGNALSLAAARATLEEVLVEEAFGPMTALAARWTAGVQDVIDSAHLPWHVTQLGARAEYAFSPAPPRDGAQAAAADDFELQQYLHLQAVTHGVLLTPFHNMALMSPATSEADVDAHTEAFTQAAGFLTS